MFFHKDPFERWSSLRLMVVLCALALVGCAGSLDRLPSVPPSETAKAQPLGIPNARFFPMEQRDDLIAEGQRALERQRQTLGIAADAQLPTAHFLAISGGGDDGAFG